MSFPDKNHIRLKLDHQRDGLTKKRMIVNTEAYRDALKLDRRIYRDEVEMP